MKSIICSFLIIASCEISTFDFEWRYTAHLPIQVEVSKNAILDKISFEMIKKHLISKKFKVITEDEMRQIFRERINNPNQEQLADKWKLVNQEAQARNLFSQPPVVQRLVVNLFESGAHFSFDSVFIQLSAFPGKKSRTINTFQVLMLTKCLKKNSFLL